MTAHKLRTPASRCTSHRPRPRITFIASISSKRAARSYTSLLRVCESHHRKRGVSGCPARWSGAINNPALAGAVYTGNTAIANRKEMTSKINTETAIRGRASYAADLSRNFWRGYGLAN